MLASGFNYAVAYHMYPGGNLVSGSGNGPQFGVSLALYKRINSRSTSRAVYAAFIIMHETGCKAAAPSNQSITSRSGSLICIHDTRSHYVRIRFLALELRFCAHLAWLRGTGRPQPA